MQQSHASGNLKTKFEKNSEDGELNVEIVAQDDLEQVSNSINFTQGRLLKLQVKV